MNGCKSPSTNGSVSPHVNGSSSPVRNGVHNKDDLGSLPINGCLQDDTYGNNSAPIAIVGMSCRLPGGVSNLRQFWEMCCRARNPWSKIPRERFNIQAYHHPDPNQIGCTNTEGGHFLREDISLFDAPFFNCTAQEANSMDPKQRILLECVYEALENSGIPKQSVFGGRVGVFVGASFNDYELNNVRDLDTSPMFQATGCHPALLSNRISYYFNLKGPSFTIDTACSSSLVALHQACQSLRAGECSMAIVAACHLNILPDFFVTMSMSRLFSDAGRSYSFDHRAVSGYGRGEGAGCIILKNVKDAEKANDVIRAFVANSGVNQDGKTNGITTPNGTSQVELMRAVYKDAGLDPRKTGFVEAHGTGTKVGDPIEAEALHEMFCEGRTPKHPILVGSVKSNIGHLEGASGVVAIIKAAMTLERGFILPNANFVKPNPNIPFAQWNMKIPNAQLVWPKGKRYASVNNFGFGGTNAHVVLEKTPFSLTVAGKTTMNHLAGESSDTLRLYVLSAFDELALKEQIKQLGIYLQQRLELFEKRMAPDLAYTLAQRRSLLPWKVSILARSLAEVVEATTESKLITQRSVKPPRIGFVFTGQGAQWHAMGRELMNTYPVFKSTMEETDRCLKRLGAKFSLLDELSKSPKDSILGHSIISQPACTAVQIALTDLLDSWHVRPSAVVGHSSGEIAAAYAARILSLEDCMAITYYRGSVVGKLKTQFPNLTGAMLAVEGSEDEIRKLIKTLQTRQATIACVNSPMSITVSGDEQAILELQTVMEQRGIFNRRLRVDVAYHSHHMRLVEQDYLSCMHKIQPRKFANAQFHSSLKGYKIEAAALQPSYWVENLTSTVRFSQAVQSMCKHLDEGDLPNISIDMLVEVGPHSALEGPIKQILKAQNIAEKIPYAPTLVRNKDARQTMLQLASTLFVKGCALDFANINFPDHKDRMPFLLTDLPTYPWLHDTAYWHESRVANNHRFRMFPRNDLIGTMAETSNDIEPVWRHVFRVDSLPWLRDHKLNSAILYPMAGYICMALEAAAQRGLSHDVKFSKFIIREFYISQPLIIEESSDVELMTTLRPHAEGTRLSSDTWDEFRIFSWAKDRSWTEHCQGIISLQNEPEPNPVTGKMQSEMCQNALAQQASSIVDSCKSSMNGEDLYEKVARVSLIYGSTFRGLSDIQRCDRMTSYRLTVPNTSAVMPFNAESDLFIHPTTLDLCIQMIWPILDSALSGLDQLYLPSYVKNLSISHGLRHRPGDVFQLYGSTPEAIEPVPCTEKFSFFVVDPKDPSKSLITFEDLTVSPVHKNTSQLKEDVGRDLCIKYCWEPTLDSLKSEELQKLLGFDVGATNAHKLELLELASYYFVDEALKEVSSDQVDSYHSRLSKLYKRMVILRESAQKGSLAPRMDLLEAFRGRPRADICKEILSLGVEGEVVVKIGSSLPPILHQEIDPSSLVLEIRDIDRHYEESDSLKRSYARAAICVDKLAHQNPHLRILEIGCSSAAAALPIIGNLDGGHLKTARFRSYDYTDSSDEALEKVKEKLQALSSLVSYRKLDVAGDILGQGFEISSYDLIIASDLTNSVKNIEQAMRNLRSLLKNDGKLLLIEQTSPTFHECIHDMLRQMWQVDRPFRENRMTFTEPEWDDLLRRTGFSGVELGFKDFPEAPEHCRTLMVASAISSEKILETDVVIIRPESLPNFSVAVLADNLEKWMGKAPTIGTLEQVDPCGKICIFLGDLEKPFLANIDTGGFIALQKLTTLAEGIFWIVRGSYTDSTSPDSNMVSGFARTIRSERAIKFVTLDLDQNQILSDYESAMAVSKVFQGSFDPNVTASDIDMEYAERKGIFYIPRLIKDDEMNRFIAQETQVRKREDQFFAQEDRPLRMTISDPGSLDSLVFVDDPLQATSLGDDEIQVEVMAIGMNFKDVMIAIGQLPSANLGQECSGIVSAVGNNVSEFAVDDRVSITTVGTFSTYARCPATSAHKMAEDMSFEVASTIPIVFCTAYYSLIDLGRLEKDETVLIHAAAGGVGQAAIMIAQKIGATIFATVGSVEKKSLLMSEYNIPDDQIFFSRDLSFADCIKTATNGKGVDVVLNSLAGSALQATWECVASFGRFIEIGKRDIVTNSTIEMAKFNNCTTFASVDLTLLAANKPRLMKRLMKCVFGGFQDGSLRPISPTTTYSISKVEAAFRTLQNGKGMGKIVVKPEIGDQVKVIPPKTNVRLLREDASYLLVGGTGGIGRSITRWMANRGARSIILASRNGSSKEETQKLVEDLAVVGVTVVAEKCDVVKLEDVRRLVAERSKDMPPIRGVIHGAMVVKNALFENCNFDDWQAVVRPKVTGAWNLHNSLLEQGQDLDFFITLSSAAGMVGDRGLASYAAANTMLDAFVKYRNQQGLAATSLDLAAIKDIGYLAENNQTVKQGILFAEEEIHEGEIHALLGAAITGKLATSCDNHCIVGVAIDAVTHDQFWVGDAKFAQLRRATWSQTEGQTTQTSRLSLSQHLKQSRTLEDATRVIYTGLIAQISSILMVPADEFDPSTPIAAYGLDSLVAIEIRNWIAREMEANVQVLELLASGSLTTLAQTIVTKSKLIKGMVLQSEKKSEGDEPTRLNGTT